MTEGTPEKIDALTERLSAYVDGEVSADEAREIEAVLARNATARRIVSELRALSERVGALPIERAPADMKDRVLATLERDALLNAGDDVAVPPTRTGWRVFQLLASAALLAITVGVGYFVYLTVVEPTAVRPGGPMQVAKVDEPPPETESPGRAGESRESLRSQMEAATPTPPTAGARDGDAVSGVAERDGREAGFAKQRFAVDAVEEKREAEMVAPPPADIAAGERSDDAAAGKKTGFISPALLTAQRPEDVENQITIEVADAAMEREVTGRIQRFLVSNSLIDAETLPKDVQLAPTQQLFTQNAVRLADATEMNQFLVRANPGIVGELLASVQSEIPSAEVRQIGPTQFLSYIGGSFADRIRPAKSTTTTPSGIVSREAGDDERTDDDTGAWESTVIPTPGSANVPVTVDDEQAAQTAPGVWRGRGAIGLAPTSGPTQRNAAEADDQGESQPASPMRQLKPALDEEPVLVLLNIARRSPATQSATAPAD